MQTEKGIKYLFTWTFFFFLVRSIVRLGIGLDKVIVGSEIVVRDGHGEMESKKKEKRTKTKRGIGSGQITVRAHSNTQPLDARVLGTPHLTYCITCFQVQYIVSRSACIMCYSITFKYTHWI